MNKKSSVVLPALCLAFVILMASVCMVHANPVEKTYVFVTPPMCVANALGEVLTVDIYISNVQNLRVFEFKLGYNTTLLGGVGVVQGPFFPSPPKSSVEELGINKTMGFVWVRISLSSSQPTVSGSGTLATITFNVTFAPAPPNRAYCVLNLYDVLLYDGSMTPIVYDSADGLYFWNSPTDPPYNGLLLDITTQNGGIGQGTFGGTFTLGEIVELSGNLTYNGYQVAAKLVVFQLLNAENETILVVTEITDNLGFFTMSFGIPPTSASLGNWTIFATAQVSDKVVSNYLTFDVVQGGPTRDPLAKFTESTEMPSVDHPVYFDASTSQPGFDGDDVCPITQYRWNFGDGNETNTTSATISHTYMHAGIYYVTLTVYAPGIPPYIDPKYNNTNTSYPPERKVVTAFPVGGYSQPVEEYIQPSPREGPIVPYIVLSITLTFSFVALKRKKTPKKWYPFLFSHKRGRAR